MVANPHIGNYGVNAEEVESDKIAVSGLVCKILVLTIHDQIPKVIYIISKNKNLVCIQMCDTRALVGYIRDNGAQNAVISTDGTSIETLQLAAVPDMKGLGWRQKCLQRTILCW
jgi:carbamoyl-phosphate synthase small subunit